MVFFFFFKQRWGIFYFTSVPWYLQSEGANCRFGRVESVSHFGSGVALACLIKDGVNVGVAKAPTLRASDLHSWHSSLQRFKGVAAWGHSDHYECEQGLCSERCSVVILPLRQPSWALLYFKFMEKYNFKVGMMDEMMDPSPCRFRDFRDTVTVIGPM